MSASQERMRALIGSGRLAPCALDRAEARIAMSHIFINGAGLTREQIDSVPLPPSKPNRPAARLLGLLRLLFRLERSMGRGQA